MVHRCGFTPCGDRVWLHRLPAALGSKAYWATTVGTLIAGTPPVIGEWILRIVRGGEDLSAVTLARFFGIHVWVLPALLILLTSIHMYLVIKLGISAVPEKGE